MFRLKLSSSGECSGCLINCRSVCNRTETLLDHLVEYDLDIMCLNETWLTNEVKHRKTTCAMTPPGYDFFHVPHAHRSGGGVGLVHRESIETRSTSVTATSFEGACCELKFKGIRIPLKVVIIYRPPFFLWCHLS